MRAMPQCLRPGTILTKDSRLCPSPHKKHPAICNSHSRGSDVLFWSLCTPYTHSAQANMQANTPIHKIKKE